MTAATAALGTVAPGFEGVRTAFDRNLTDLGEDLWGGVADTATHLLLAALHEAVTAR